MIIHLNFKDKVVLILFLKIHLFSLHHKNGTRGTCTRDITFLHIYIYTNSLDEHSWVILLVENKPHKF